MTGKNRPNPGHINRLKMDYVRKPTLMNYFLDKVATNNKSEEHVTHSEAEQSLSDSNVSTDNTIPVVNHLSTSFDLVHPVVH